MSDLVHSYPIYVPLEMHGIGMTIITNQECFDKDTSTRLNEDLGLDLGNYTQVLQ